MILIFRPVSVGLSFSVSASFYSLQPAGILMERIFVVFSRRYLVARHLVVASGSFSSGRAALSCSHRLGRPIKDLSSSETMQCLPRNFLSASICGVTV